MPLQPPANCFQEADLGIKNSKHLSGLLFFVWLQGKINMAFPFIGKVPELSCGFHLWRRLVVFVFHLLTSLGKQNVRVLSDGTAGSMRMRVII